jgi:hypothetical protein
MKRYWMLATMLTWIAFPMLAGAEGVVIPPEANWTRYPPAQGAVDAAQLTELLVRKGIITPQEAAQLTRPQVLTSSGTGRGAVQGTAISVFTSP